MENLIGETEDGKQALTILDLYNILGKIMDVNSESQYYPVMLVENVYQRGSIIPTIRHMLAEDVALEKDLQLTCNIVFSQCDKGVVLGFVTKAEE